MSWIFSKIPLRRDILFPLILLLSCRYIHGDSCHAQCSCSRNMTTVICHEVKTLSVIQLSSYTRYFTITHSSLGPVFNHSLSTLLELREVDLSYNYIQTLPDTVFRYLDSLRKLSLNNNNLYTLPDYLLQFSSRIDYLDLSHNRFQILPDAPFRFITNLKVLNLSYNILHTPELGLRFQGLVHLEMIDFSGNDFTTIPSNSFDKTHTWTNQVSRHLNFSHCGLQSLTQDSFNHLEGLHSISFQGNNQLPVSNLSSALNSTTFERLRILDISDMEIENISEVLMVLKVVPLSKLYMNNNKLTSIPELLSDYQRNLKVIEANNNLIITLGPSVVLIGGLKHLDMSNNRISTVDSNIGTSLTNLEYLNIAHNMISDGMVPVTSMTLLKTLDLSHNNLQQFDLPVTLVNLHILNLAGNQISEIRSMVGLTQLEELDMSDNRLEQVGNFLFPESEKIRKVNLSNNSIIAIGHQAFKPHSPRIIDLSRNKLQRVQNLGWKNTIEIRLQHNLLSVIETQTFYALYELKGLDLSNNKLADIDPTAFTYLINVTSLNLEYNNLSNNENIERSFVTMENLVHINLGHNNLSTILSNTFKHNKLLHTINLNENHLSGLNPDVFKYLYNLKVLDFSNNRLICDCILMKLRDWMRKTAINIRQASQTSYKCHGPPGRSSMLVLNYETEKFECHQNILYIIIFSSIGFLVMLVGVVTALVFKGYCAWRRTLKPKGGYSVGFEETGKAIERNGVMKTKPFRHEYANGYSSRPWSPESMDYEVEALMNKKHASNGTIPVPKKIPLVGLTKNGVLPSHKLTKNNKKKLDKKNKKKKKITEDKDSRRQDDSRKVSEKEIRFLRMYKDFARRYENQPSRRSPVIDRNGNQPRRRAPIIDRNSVIDERMIPYYYSKNGVRYSTSRRPRQLPVPREIRHGDVIRYPIPHRASYDDGYRGVPRYTYSVPDIPSYATLPRRHYPAEPQVHIRQSTGDVGRYPRDRSPVRQSNMDTRQYIQQRPAEQQVNNDLCIEHRYPDEFRNHQGDLQGYQSDVQGHIEGHQSDVRGHMRQRSVGNLTEFDEPPANLKHSKSDTYLVEANNNKYHTISAKSSKGTNNITKWI